MFPLEKAGDKVRKSCRKTVSKKWEVTVGLKILNPNPSVLAWMLVYSIFDCF
jgi:hypothetical protein